MRELKPSELKQVEGGGANTGALTGGATGAAALGWAGMVGVTVTLPLAVGVIGAGLVIGGIAGYLLAE